MIAIHAHGSYNTAMENIYNDDEIRLREKLYDLRIEHRDLDDIIERLNQDPDADQLQINRLKKRKLVIKDLIAKIENELIPDEHA